MKKNDADMFEAKIYKRLEYLYNEFSEEGSIHEDEVKELVGNRLWNELVPLLWGGFEKECTLALSKVPYSAIIIKFEPQFYDNNLLFVFNEYVKRCISFFVKDIKRTLKYLKRNKYENNLNEHLGLSPFFWKEVENFRYHLENLNKYALTYKLNNPQYTQEIIEAIQSERRISESEIDRIVNFYAKKKREERFKGIAETLALTLMSIADYEIILYGYKNGYIHPDIRRFWIDMDDARVRPAHRKIAEMNPEGVPPDGKYKTPLGPLRFPRDPKGRLDNILYCRCMEEYKIVEKRWYKWKHFNLSKSFFNNTKENIYTSTLQV